MEIYKPRIIKFKQTTSPHTAFLQVQLLHTHLENLPGKQALSGPSELNLHHSPLSLSHRQGTQDMAARAHPTVQPGAQQPGALGQPQPRHWTLSWGRWWAEDWPGCGSVDGSSLAGPVARQDTLRGAEAWPCCSITGAGAESLEQGLTWSPGPWAR